MEDRINQDIGELRAHIDNLTAQVDRLSKQMEVLNGVLNKGRGVQFALLLVPGVVGVVVTVLGYFGVRLTIGS
jgi:hypothetical protein